MSKRNHPAEMIPDPDPVLAAAFEKFVATIPCSCRGEAHDECSDDDVAA